eukprot:Skav211021  [mRNA]  locus=scaffold610:104749:106951:- [translate_table: standard]
MGQQPERLCTGRMLPVWRRHRARASVSAAGEEVLKSAEALFPHRLDAYERNLACRLGGPGIALQAALMLAKQGYQEPTDLCQLRRMNEYESFTDNDYE